MYKASLFQFFAALLTFFLLENAIAIELRSIRPIIEDEHGSRLGKRADVSALDLRSSETFFWGGASPSDAVLANFTVYMPGENENILTTERFYGMLKSINCTNHDMTLAFKDDATFAYAQGVWDWVNGADNHTFVMVAGVGDCEWNRRRQPFKISTITYDEEKNVAHLSAELTKWGTFVHSYDLDVGHAPMTVSHLPARDVSQDLSLDFSSSFPYLIKLTKNGLSTALECTNCVTTGKFIMELKASQQFSVPTGASIRLSPQGVSATAEIKLTESGELTDSIEFEKRVQRIPVSGITIPGVVTIGPNLDISMGFEISAFEGSASISAGATVSLKDSAVVEVDLLNPLNSKFSGWIPDVNPLPVTVDARVSGGLQVYFLPAVKLVAEVLGQGFEIGLDLKMPYVGIKAEAVINQGGVCNTQKEAGVEIGANTGAELSIKTANENEPSKELLDLTLATTDFPIGDNLCFAFGEDGVSAAAPPSSSGPALPPNSRESCIAKNGQSGECMSTGACASSGGQSEAGHCPGDEDIQCCTHPAQSSGDDGQESSDNGDEEANDKDGDDVDDNDEKSGDTKGSDDGDEEPSEDIDDESSETSSCKTGNGTLGTCISTSDCSSNGGTSEAGHCPGTSDIQCCTYSSCNVGGQEGQCQSTSSCSGTSSPGHCPGSNNIQCCTS